MITISLAAKTAFPKAKFGAMVVEGLNGISDRSIMDELVFAGMEEIRAMYPGYDRKAVSAAEPLCHYTAYYKRHKKSYHVLGQLESILLKGKCIPPVGAAVECMFLAEVKNLLLTAGHDLDHVEGGLSIDIATTPAVYIGLSGREQPLIGGDLYLHDAKGILSSILGGPDARTKITGSTRAALYFVYGVDGVAANAVELHLQTISAYLTQAIPGAGIRSINVL